MGRKIYIARPRLDCSFKPGPVPAVEGPPRNAVLRTFSDFLDNLADYHRSIGDMVTVAVRPLWQFELQEMQQVAQHVDRLYFPHKLKQQFQIGDCAVYYKTSPLMDYMTVDPEGWGADMSWLPLTSYPATTEAHGIFAALQKRIAENVSIFEQPSADRSVGESDYLLFVCQIPHDEAIRFYSDVSVLQALGTVLDYAAARGRRVVVKGHPANPKSMQELRSRTEASPVARWVDDVSIHTCLAGAERVFLVNSGTGFEAMLHDKPIVRFGRAEYAPVVPLAAPEVSALVELEGHRHSSAAYAGFIAAFVDHCIRYDEPESFHRVLGRLSVPS